MYNSNFESLLLMQGISFYTLDVMYEIVTCCKE